MTDAVSKKQIKPTGEDVRELRRLLRTTTNIVYDAATSATQSLRTRLPKGRTLTHYTTGAGAKGIIETGSLWATNPLYLNDARELSHIGDPLDRAWEATRRELHDYARGAHWFLDMLQGSAGQQDASLVPEENGHVYVTSFCEQPDLLSQWRGYGKTTDGPAYSLTFNAEGLRELYPFSPGATPKSLQTGTVRLVKAEYDPDKQTEVLTQLLVDACCGLLSHINGSKDKTDLRVVRTLSSALQASIRLHFGAVFKHEGFIEEDEWRLVVRSNIPVKDARPEYRVTPHGLAPYYPLGDLVYEDDENVSVAHLPLTGVTQGPPIGNDLALWSMQGLLHKHIYDVEVRASSIPYRPG